MTHTRIFAALRGASLALAAGLLGACSAPSASLAPMIGSYGLDGDFGASTTGSAVASTFDDLGIDDNEAAPGLKAHIGFLGANLSLSAFDTEYEGSGVTDGSITLGGTTIGASTAVDTTLDMAIGRALLTWNLIPLGPVELGIGIGASLIDLDLLMDDGLGNTLESDELIPIPLLGVRAAWTWGPVKVLAEVGGLAVEVDGDEAQVIDGDIEASVGLFDVGSLLVGYRLIDIDAEYDDADDRVEADLEMSGFYLGLKFSF